MTTKRWLGVLGFTIFGILLFASWLLPGQAGFWYEIDKSVFFFFNRAGCHNAGNAATTANQERNKAFAGKTPFTENPIHNEGDTSHVATGFEESKHEEEN